VPLAGGTSILRTSEPRSSDLIKIYLAEGNQAEAIHQNRLYRDRLNGQLGLDPSSEMAELVGHLGNGRSAIGPTKA
jgi:hypothetical protein